MWSVVGTSLLVFGARWVLQSRAWFALLLICGAACVGVAKSRFILDRAARRIVERITSRGDGNCIGGFLSMRTWGMVAVMVGAGRLLRSDVHHRIAIGAIYVAVGSGLVLGARLLWRAWHHQPTAASERPSGRLE